MALVLATPAQLRSRLQDPTLDDAIAQQAIDSAVALVKGAWGQTVEFVANDTVVLTGGERDLVLPQRPVVVDDTHPLTVVELVDGTNGGVPAVEGVTFRRLGGILRRHGRTREGVRVTSRHGVPDVYPTGVWAPAVRVTYSHGYRSEAELPAGLTDVVLKAASSLASNPGGLRSIALDGEVTMTWATESLGAASSLVDDIRRDLRGIGARRGVVFSV